MFLVYHSEGCDIDGTVFCGCHINDYSVLHMHWYAGSLHLCLMIIVVAGLVPNNCDFLVCLEEIMRCFSMQTHSIVVFSFDVLLGLTWHMLTPCYDSDKSPLSSMIM